LAWNWERGTDSGYYHLNVNSLPQAGYFAIESGGHRWGFNDSYSPVGWPTERMRLTQTGLGIGTTSPVAPLHVYGSANSGTYEGSGTSNTTAYIKGSGDYPTALTLDADGSSDDVARVRILNAGANKWQINYGDDIIWSYATWTERMRVSSAGILSIHAGAGEWAKIYGGGSAGDGAWAQYFDSASNHMGYVGFPGNEDLHLQANCANPASQIFIRTAVGYCAYFNADGYFKPYTNNVFRCGQAGMVWNEVHTTDVYTHDGGVHTSDVLEKTDVIDTPLGVDFIKELRPVQYRWIDGTRSHQGFIAQDVETVLNGTAGTTASDQGMWCVVEVDTTDDINEDVLDDDGNVVGVERTTVPGEQFERQSLRYNELMAPMVKALQEIVTRLEVLESA
jgi:hypothetical protein